MSILLSAFPQVAKKGLQTIGPVSGWTSVASFDGNRDVAEIDNIQSAFTDEYFGTVLVISGFFWKPDGTKLTISDTGADKIKTFTVDPPWDVSSAVVVSSLNVTNAQGLWPNKDGTAFITRTVVGDTFVKYPMTDWQVGNGTPTALSDISKADLGFGGTEDPWALLRPDFSYAFFGLGGPQRPSAKYTTLTGGSLDNFTIVSTESEYVTSGYSTTTTDGKFALCARNAQGVAVVEFTDPLDITTATNLSGLDGDSLAAITTCAANITPSWCWIDPDDTTYVWVSDYNGSQPQMERFKTTI
jgi:hypothetical protein